MLIGTALIIPGGPGMGKSALAIAAAHDPRVAGHFKSARHFVGLDAARDGEAMLRALGQSLGVPTQGAAREVLGLIAAQAAQAPLLAILDNAETPHESDRDGTRDWLAHLTDLPGLTLVVTVRGETPRLPAATCLPDLEQLDAVEACALFAREAQQVAADDPDLPALLAELEGHALSLILVARVADGQTRLAPVLHRYRTIRADMLAEGKGDTRLNSVRVSLRLSLESPMMTAGARRLVALLALLPDGMHEADFETLLPGAGADAALLLARLRLAKNHNARLRMLAPLREAARVECGVTTADFERLFEFVAGILLGAQSCLRAGSGQVMLALAQREAGNLDAMLLVAIAVGLGLDVLVPLSCALGFFHSATGLGSAAALESVRKVNQ